MEFREKLTGYVQVYSFLCQIIPYADPDLEMFYSYGRTLLFPHLPLGRDTTIVKVGDEVALQVSSTRARVSSGAILMKEGETQYVESPTDVVHREVEGRNEGSVVRDH